LAVLFFAVDLRAVVRFAAAGATSCPQASLGNGTVLVAMLTPLACAFPHLQRCFVARVAHVTTTRHVRCESEQHNTQRRMSCTPTQFAIITTPKSCACSKCCG
jgi:hypothetical protein